MPKKQTTKFNRDLWWKLFRAVPAQFKTSTIEQAVMKTLKYYDIPFYLDDFGNIFSVRYPDRPLLNAHMDSVQGVMQFPSDMKFQRSDKGQIFKGDYCLGADDKVGLYIALNYLRDNPNTNFLFTQGEETGLLGVTDWVRNYSKSLDRVTFGLTLDRRGAGDILCTQNSYGTQEFEDILAEVSATGGHGFTPARGTCSDADKLSNYISCANLSVGYYGAHTQSEYVVMSEVFGTEDFVRDIIEQVGDIKFDKPTPKYPVYKGGYSYKNYGKDYTKKIEVVDKDKDKVKNDDVVKYQGGKKVEKFDSTAEENKGPFFGHDAEYWARLSYVVSGNSIEFNPTEADQYLKDLAEERIKTGAESGSVDGKSAEAGVDSIKLDLS